jgi:hypothetical protein
MISQIGSTAAIFILLLLSAVIPSPGGYLTPSPGGKQTKTKTTNDVVYVCACLGTRSCSCMTEAKTEGPCACGTSGGPPLKAVPRDSDWAKDNREALAK